DHSVTEPKTLQQTARANHVLDSFCQGLTISSDIHRPNAGHKKTRLVNDSRVLGSVYCV
ncbi:MAG: hypothetical protein ACI85S_002970, partial [Pseudohongiellaceae bacterium]